MYSFLAYAVLFQPLRQDAKLAETHPVRELAVSARTLCADLSKIWGVPLSCDNRISDDFVILVSKPRSLKDLMVKVAENFGWQWTVEGAGYQLEPTSSFLKQAQTGRAEALVAQLSPLRIQAKRDLAEIAKTDKKALQKEMEGISNQIGESLGDRESKMSARMEAIQRYMDPLAPIALELIANLPDADFVRWADQQLVFSTSPGPFETRMPAVVSIRITAVIKQMKAELEAERKAQDPEDRINFSFDYMNGGLVAPLDQAAVARVVLSSDYRMRVTVMTANHEIVASSEVSMNEPPAPIPTILSPELRAAILEKYPVQMERGQGDEYLGFYARWMSQVAGKLNLDLISDAFDDEQTLYDGMDAEEKKKGIDSFEGRVADGWLQKRSRTWAKRRDEQMPRRLVPELASPTELMSIESRANVVSRLTRAQIESSLCPFATEDYWFLRGWNSLTPIVKQAALAGRPIPLAALTAEMFDFLRQKEGMNGFGWDGDWEMDFGMGAFAEPEFQSAKQRRNVLIQDLVDDSVAQTATNRPPKYAVDNFFPSMYPGFLDPQASFKVQAAIVPGLYNADFQNFMLPQSLMHQDVQEISLSDFDMEAMLAKSELHAASITGYQFVFHMRKDASVRYETQVSAFEKAIVKDRSTWSLNLLARIKAHEEQRKAQQYEYQRQQPPPS